MADVETAFTPDGRAILRDTQTGELTIQDPGKAGARIASGRYAPVSEAEAAAAAKAKEHDRSGAGNALLAAGEAAASSAFDTLASPFTAGKALINKFQQSRTNDPYELERLKAEEEQSPSGRKLLENLAFFGGGGDRAANDYAEAARERAEAHPLAAGAGSLAGGVLAGGALTRGAAALGEGAEALTGSRALGAATEGVAAGAGFGAAAAPEEAYIRNEDLTAESVLASMGTGAIFGGALGLATHAGSELLSRARAHGAEIDATAEKANTARAALTGELPEEQPSTIADWLRSFSEERTTKAIGARGTDIRKLGRTAEAAEEEMHRMARNVLDYELEDGTKVFRAFQSKAELAENLGRAEEEVGSKLGALRDKANTFLEEKAPELRPSTQAIADRIESEVAAPLTASAVPDVSAKARPVQEIADAVRNLGPEASLEQLTKLRQDLDSVVYPRPTAPGLPAMAPAHAQELVKVRGIIEEQIQATMDKALAKMEGGAELGSYQRLKAQFRSFREANQIAGKAQLQELGNRVISPTDYLMGGAVLAGEMASGGGLAAVKAAAATGIHHALREHGSAMLAVLADKLADRIERKISLGVGDFFEQAIQRAPLAATEIAKAAPPASAAAARRAAIPAALEVFRGKHGDNVAAYRARAQEIARATENFGTGVRENTGRALGGLTLTAPKLSGKVVTGATRAATFLQSKLPTPLVNTSSFTPNAARPVPSDFDLQTFARYYAAVANPLSVVRDLQRGQVTREQVEALQAVYPKLYESVRNAVLEKLRVLDGKGITVPYQASLQLDLLLNLNGAGEPTARPDFMARFQQMAAQQDQAQKQNQPKPVKLAPRLTASQDAANALP